jgi:hypothetical protein
VVLAELDVRHTRPIAPTRRLALGEHLYLPTDPAPGFGGILLASVVAAFGQELDEDLADDLDVLLDQLERGAVVRQPRLRTRFQADVHGLEASRHRLLGEGEQLQLQLEDKGHPLPQVLAAAYAASMLAGAARPPVFRLLRKATLWAGDPGPKLLAFLSGDEAALRPPTARGGVVWALEVLGFEDDRSPGQQEVQQRYRDLVRLAHPDAGGDADEAGRRITELTEARRVLLG